MSFFECKIRQLNEVLPHPNADKLELAVIGGYRAVVRKGEFKAGDYALYIPTDAVLIQSVAEGLGIAPYLVGKNKNRVKAIRLRGEVSQGIVISTSTVLTYARVWFQECQVSRARMSMEAIAKLEHLMVQFDTDLTEFLQIVKYEEEIPIEMKGHVRRWPEYLDHFDVENVNHPDCINVLQSGEEVYVTEKLHGTNMAVSIGPGLEEGESVYVCSRRLALKESQANLYWIAARKYNLPVILQQMVFHYYDLYGAPIDEVGGEITIRGEVVGVQDLKYGFARGEPGFFAFDIRIDSRYLQPERFKEVCQRYRIPMVQELYHGPYDYEHLKALAEGYTTVGTESHIREGIVVRPAHERRDNKIGRVILKFLNEEYLTRKEGSELH